MAKFQKGISGNPAGRKPQGKEFDDVLRRQLNKGSGKQSKALAQALIELALSKRPGSVAALKLIVERVGGRPGQKPPEPPRKPEAEALTPEQIDARLAELLSRPEMQGRIEHIIQSRKEGQKGE